MSSTLSDSHPNSLLTVYPNPADCITTSGRGYAAGAVPTFIPEYCREESYCADSTAGTESIYE